MQLQRKHTNERSALYNLEKDELSTKIADQRARAFDLQTQLDQQKGKRSQEQVERDAAQGKLARLEKEREAWRADAVARVQGLEEKHVELTTMRQEAEVLG